jgi:hypothetical protein
MYVTDLLVTCGPLVFHIHIYVVLSLLVPYSDFSSATKLEGLRILLLASLP